jgi:hypothetical protein
MQETFRTGVTDRNSRPGHEPICSPGPVGWLALEGAPE